MPAAIEANRLGKRYRLGVDASGYDTLREALRRRLLRSGGDAPEVWALRNLTFGVDEGEALGVIGPNGAGKTTLLKVLAGITEPTTGEARTRGRVGALLDVGTGLHPELTGRENVFLSGAILGMRKAAVGRRFDEIVDFAGIEPFLDTPVKRYSAGMRLRLAFAVAAHIEPPIIVVDEVLAVGDASFQQKCIGKVAEIGRHGRTILFVSHDLGAVTRLCGRAIWLEGGRIRRDGPAHEVVAEYLDSGAGAPLLAEFDGDQHAAVALQRVWVQDPEGRVLSSIRRGEPFTVALQLALRERHPALDFSVSLTNRDGVRVLADARSDWSPDAALPGDPGIYDMRITIPGLLTPGPYIVGLWVGSEYDTLLHHEVITLSVEPRADDRQHWLDRRRVVQPEVRWEVRHEPP